MVVVVSRKHALARKKSIVPGEISKLPLVLYDQSTSTRQRLDAFFRESQITPQVILELSSVEGMKRMVEAGLGATIIPESALLIGSNQIRALRIEGRPLTRSVGLAMPLQQHLPNVIAVAVELMKDRFREIKLSLDRVVSESDGEQQKVGGHAA